MEGQSGEDTSFVVQKIEKEDLFGNIWWICEELLGAFPKDIPKGVPPKRMGHEFKIDLELYTAPIHKYIYKLNPFKIQEAKNEIDSMFEHGVIRPSQSP